MAWYNTVEFYVIAGAVAAAVVALSALPAGRGPAREHLLGGELSDSGLPDDAAEPGLEIEVDDNRVVHIRRTGLRGVGDMGAASLAVTVAGFDIVIEERLIPGRHNLERRDTADFRLDFLGPERYHIRYNSEAAAAMAAFTLPVREGIKISRKLS